MGPGGRCGRRGPHLRAGRLRVRRELPGVWPRDLAVHAAPVAHRAADIPRAGSGGCLPGPTRRAGGLPAGRVRQRHHPSLLRGTGPPRGLAEPGPAVAVRRASRHGCLGIPSGHGRSSQLGHRGSDRSRSSGGPGAQGDRGGHLRRHPRDDAGRRDGGRRARQGAHSVEPTAATKCAPASHSPCPTTRRG